MVSPGNSVWSTLRSMNTSTFTDDSSFELVLLQQIQRDVTRKSWCSILLPLQDKSIDPLSVNFSL